MTRAEPHVMLGDLAVGSPARDAPKVLRSEGSPEVLAGPAVGKLSAMIQDTLTAGDVTRSKRSLGGAPGGRHRALTSATAARSCFFVDRKHRGQGIARGRA